MTRISAPVGFRRSDRVEGVREHLLMTWGDGLPPGPDAIGALLSDAFTFDDALHGGAGAPTPRGGGAPAGPVSAAVLARLAREAEEARRSAQEARREARQVRSASLVRRGRRLEQVRPGAPAVGAPAPAPSPPRLRLVGEGVTTAP